MFPFDRFVEAVDGWARANAARDVLIQIGSGNYIPASARWLRVMPVSEFDAAIRDCNLVVAHLGMGSLIAALQAEKPLIMLPRHRSLGEHTSDHQIHGTKWLRSVPGVWIADEISDLHRLLDAFAAGQIVRSPQRAARYASAELLDGVSKFIHRAS